MMQAAADARALHPLIAALFDRHQISSVSSEAFDAFAAQPGRALVLFLEDPAKYRETLDIAVIAPEIIRAYEGTLRCAALLPPAARELAPRFGIQRWPAIVVLRDGGYVGAIEGLRDWSDYVATMASLLEAPVRRAPGVGIAVRGPVAGCGS